MNYLTYRRAQGEEPVAVGQTLVVNDKWNTVRVVVERVVQGHDGVWAFGTIPEGGPAPRVWVGDPLPGIVAGSHPRIAP